MAKYFGFEAFDIKTDEPFVFISYKSEDWETVAKYAKYLNDNDVNVWYDNGIREGEVWDDKLMTIISHKNCVLLLFFISSRATSAIIRQETKQARDENKPIIGIFLEPNVDLKYLLGPAINNYISERQFINTYAHTMETACAIILQTVKSELNAIKGNNNLEIHLHTDSSSDKIYMEAEFFYNRYKLRNDIDDIEEAKTKYSQLTVKSPLDYRGWFGLLKCVCEKRTFDEKDEQMIFKYIDSLKLIKAFDLVKLDCQNLLRLYWEEKIIIAERFTTTIDEKSNINDLNSIKKKITVFFPDNELDTMHKEVVLRYEQLKKQLDKISIAMGIKKYGLVVVNGMEFYFKREDYRRNDVNSTRFILMRDNLELFTFKPYRTTYEIDINDTTSDGIVVYEADFDHYSVETDIYKYLIKNPFSNKPEVIRIPYNCEAKKGWYRLSISPFA